MTHCVRALGGCLCLIALACPPPAFPFSGVPGAAPAVPERAGRDGPAVFSSVRYFAANDWTAMDDVEGNWSGRYAPRGGSNLALSFLRAEAGVAFDSWRIGYVYRRDAVVEASRDTLDLLHLQRNNLPIPAGRTFALEFYGNAFQGEGLRVAKGVELYGGESTGLRAGVGVSLLRGIRSRSGSVLGTVGATAPNTFAFDASWIDRNTNKTFPFMTAGSPDGSGYALDGMLEFRWAGRNRLNMAIEDVVSRIHWSGLPATQARATSNTAGRDTQGFIIYQPAIAGRNLRLEHTQRLDPKGVVEYLRDFGRLSAGAGAFVVRGNVMPTVALDYRLNDSWRVSAEHDFRFGGTGIGLRYRALSLSIFSESLHLDRAKAYGVAAQLVVPF